jgi:serine/threonine-protein kinase HipA
MFKKRGQEDFCQALGIVSENRYQKENGPLLKQCFALLREVSSAPVLDLARLLDAVIFNFLVGNNDAHGKNFRCSVAARARRAWRRGLRRSTMS